MSLPCRYLPAALLGAGLILPIAAADGADPAADAGDLWTRDVGDARLRLVDLSAITQVAVGASDGDGEELAWSQTGAHDPRRAGFDFQALELGIAGAVDPYFRAQAHMLITEDHGL